MKDVSPASLLNNFEAAGVQHGAERRAADAPPPVAVVEGGIESSCESVGDARDRCSEGKAGGIRKSWIENAGLRESRDLGDGHGREDQVLTGDAAQALKSEQRVGDVIEHAPAPHNVMNADLV